MMSASHPRRRRLLDSRCTSAAAAVIREFSRRGTLCTTGEEPVRGTATESDAGVVIGSLAGSLARTMGFFGLLVFTVATEPPTAANDPAAAVALPKASGAGAPSPTAGTDGAGAGAGGGGGGGTLGADNIVLNDPTTGPFPPPPPPLAGTGAGSGSGGDVMVKEEIFRGRLSFPRASATRIVQSLNVPTASASNVIAFGPEEAVVVTEEQLPP